MATSLFDEPAGLESRLRQLGLRDVDAVRTHANRTVMLTLRRRVLRIHRGYAFAPDPVLAAIVRFLRPGLRRDARRAAERELLAYPVHVHVAPKPRRSHVARSRPEDAPWLDRLREAHAALNTRHFAGGLGPVPIAISGRMRRRLGELALDLATGRPDAITISRRHLRSDAWAEVEHTMLHEMIHQWQAETGLPLDHGATFRDKARELGALPRATRRIGMMADLPRPPRHGH